MLSIVYRVYIILICLLSSYSFLTFGQVSQPSQKLYPSGTTITINQVETSEFPKVKLFGSVSRSGIPLTGLTAKNFRVREDNVEQGPIKVLTQREAISAVVLLDISGSMKGAIEDTKSAAIGFVNSLSEEDKIEVITFHERIDTIYPLGNNFAAAKAAISKIRHRGDTALYDGIYSAVSSIKDVAGRRVVIVLSDGVDDDGYGKQLSKRDLDEPLMLGIVTNIPIYTIGLGSKMDAGILKTLAGTSGAEYVNAPTKSELEGLYARIGQQLSTQYEVSYTSSKPDVGGLREVKLDYVIPSRKPYAAPEPVLNAEGKVASYKAPNLNQDEMNRLAKMAGVGKLAVENNIKPLEKYIEKTPAKWPAAVPVYSKAGELKFSELEGSSAFSFNVKDQPKDFIADYNKVLLDDDWYITSKSEAGEFLFIMAYKNESVMTIGAKSEDAGSKVNIEYDIAAEQALIVDKNNANQIIAADGRDVIIAGDGGVIIVSGGCGKLTVSGSQNQVQCDSVKEVEILGGENVVIAGMLGNGVISGDKNEMAWNKGMENKAPKIETKGSGNKTTRLE